MDATRIPATVPAAHPAGPALPPFGGLGFDLCGLGQVCARLPLQRPAPLATPRPAAAARA